MRHALFLPACFTVLAAQEPIDAALNARLREEGLRKGQAFATLQTLCDRFGPRLMASPNYQAAAAWVLERAKAWGLANGHLETFEFGHPGWTNEHCAVHALAPYKDPLGVEVLAWTPSTKGVATGNAMRLVLPEEPLPAEFDAFLASRRAEVKGRVVFVGSPKPLPVLPEGREKPREDEAELKKVYDPTQPPSGRTPPGRPGPKREGALDAKELDKRLNAFLVQAGALARVNDAAMRHGLIRAFNNRTFDPSQAVPTVAMRREDYGRLWRLMEAGETVRLALDIRNRLHPDITRGTNIVAELPGREKPEEVVILSAHFDSWHTAPGATDNGANCVAMLEALRLLKAAGAQPRRTLRVVLFDGEEQGLLGAQAYVNAHFGTFEKPLPEFGKLAACIGMDSGAGQLRGVNVFGPPAASQVLRELLAPFQDLGVVGAIHRAWRPAKPDYSDIVAFYHAGLPAISPTQDGLEYFTTTWHTPVDSLERVPPEDLARTSTVLASLAYHLAERAEPLPRFTAQDMPAPARPR